MQTHELVGGLAKRRVWIRVCAVTNGLLAFFTALTLIGLPLAFLLGWVARLEWQAARLLDRLAQPSYDHTTAVADAAGVVDRISLHFKLQVIVAIVMLPAMLLILILAIALKMHGVKS